MEGFDSNVAINMPEQNKQGFWGSAFNALGGMGKDMEAHPEIIAIALDMLGKGFDPNNPFAGVGTALGKSSLASKAEAAGQKHSTDMFQQLLKALTPGDKPGPTSFSVTPGKDGKSHEYGIKGLSPIAGIDEPTKMPGVSTPQSLTKPMSFDEKYGGY